MQYLYVGLSLAVHNLVRDALHIILHFLVVKLSSNQTLDVEHGVLGVDCRHVTCQQ